MEEDPPYLKSAIYNPVIYGGQSLYEVLNLWSVGELYLWNLNYSYKIYMERRAIEKPG